MSADSYFHAQNEAYRQKDDTLDAVGGDPVPGDSAEAEAKKNGLMGKIRGVRVGDRLS